ncbi:MAG: dTDP-4-dehydrorhamnose reductase [Acidobacteria bacterium]|nr:MAG: dTDP-4-dehydrorhamnose reductase [Acidobacteriota bacterium]
MVGRDLTDALTSRDETVVALKHSDLDITDARCVNECVAEHRPSIIVNCAAYTAVDQAEAEEAAANAINGSSVELLALAANEVDALLVQISTDFVFDGAKREPYDVTDATAPLSAYGRSKLLGEVAAQHAARSLILRTSWLFGVHGNNFVEAMRRQIGKGTNPLRVVDDQRGRPTYTPHLANAIIRLAIQDARGIVHYADEEECTWFDFTRAIVEETKAEVTVKPIATADYPRAATVPAYSVLSTERYERITGVHPESWREGLREYLSVRA